MLKRFFCCLLFAVVPVLSTARSFASAYDGHPKLVILLVADQFREDYLERYRADFKDQGFNLFLEHGAFFPDCYYGYANLVTAAGHATLATGAYTDGHGIASNQWWDLSRNTQRPITSVEDPRYTLVGLPSNSTRKNREGASPRNLLASTFGDEVRLATKGEAKLYGVSLKDRAAILTAGHTANGAFWIDPQSGAFITSTYYMRQLPDWATAFNLGGAAAQARNAAGVDPNANFFHAVGGTDQAIQYELAFAEALITGEKLGSGSVTDVLTISISSTDILGHRVGPDAPEQHQLVDALDVDLDQFFRWIDKNVPGGLHDTWIAFSADHGVAPVPLTARQLGLPAATINVKALMAALNAAMNNRFSPGQHLEYLLPHQELPYISLNQPMFEHAGINEQEGERAIQEALPDAIATSQPGAAHVRDADVKPSQARIDPTPRIFRSYTRLQMASLQPGIPPTEFGRLIAHSYSPNGGWYVMVIPDAYQMQSVGSGTTHYSPYSYDRHVPLAFYGSAFVPGTYRGRVEPVDLAATLAALLNVNQPSASIGRVLQQAIRTEPEVPEKRRVLHHIRHTHEAAPRSIIKPRETAPAEKPATPSPAATTVPKS